MATSGSYNTNTIKPASTTMGLVFAWSRTSFSSALNTSTISWTLKGRGAAHANHFMNGQNFKQIVNGTTYTSAPRVQVKNGVTVLSGTTVIPHNPDGTMTFSASTTAEMYYYGTPNITGNANFTLDSIPRASTITTFNPFTIGSDIAWEVDRKYAPNTHKVELLFGGQVIASETTTNASGTLSINLAAKNKMLGLVPNAPSGQATLRVTTYTNANYNVQVGIPQMEVVTATVGAEVQPDFTSISHSEYVSNVASLVGAYVKTKSRLNLAINGAVAGQGSTIKSNSISVAGQVINGASGTTGIINQSGLLNVTATVTDNRDRSVSKFIQITVLDYTPPTIENVSFVRSKSNGDSDPLGEFVKVEFKGSVGSLLNDDVEKNSLNYKIKSKKSSEGLYTTKTDVNHSTLNYNGSTVLGVYEVDYSFNFVVEVSDIFETSISAGLIPIGVVLQHWSLDSTAFGMLLPSQEYNVYVGSKGIKSNGPIIDKNGIEVIGAYDYVVESSSNSTMEWNKWGNGLAILTISKRIDLYDTADETVTLPFPFVGYPTVSFGTEGGTNVAFRNALLGLIGYVDGTSLTIGKTVRSANTQTDNQTITIMGYWK